MSWRLIDDWPPLAWVCHLHLRGVTVWHGGLVETTDNFFAEAVWDGDFSAGNLHETDVVFGSGAHLANHGVIFVSSGATTDRLHLFWREDDVFVSNSLAALAATSLAVLQPGTQSLEKISLPLRMANWVQPGFSPQPPRIMDPFGIGGELEVVYFHNVDFRWEKTKHWIFTGLTEKPYSGRRFTTYAEYVDFLVSSVRKIALNAKADGRTHSYDLVSSISSGYDSPFVAALASESGALDKAFTIPQGRHGKKDSGLPVAKALEIKVETVNRHEWKKKLTLPMEDALRSSGLGSDIPLTVAPIFGCVYLSGFNGGGVWNKKLSGISPHAPRKDLTGLGLTEWRLWATTIHVPIPFLGVRALPDINAISNSSELSPWDLKGNFYSRPIPRRFLEERGVERGSFGTEKKAVSTGGFEVGSTSRARWRYLQSLEWRERGRAIRKRFLSRLFVFDPAKATQVVLWVARFVPGWKPKRVQTHKNLSRWQNAKIFRYPLSALHYRATVGRYYSALVNSKRLRG